MKGDHSFVVHITSSGLLFGFACRPMPAAARLVTLVVRPQAECSLCPYVQLSPWRFSTWSCMTFRTTWLFVGAETLTYERRMVVWQPASVPPGFPAKSNTCPTVVLHVNFYGPQSATCVEPKWDSPIPKATTRRWWTNQEGMFPRSRAEVRVSPITWHVVFGSFERCSI